MARPRKKGLEYYPVDVRFMDDVKVMRITNRCGPEAVAALICLLGEIYAEKGYYMEQNEDTAFIIGQKCGLCEDKVLEIIDRAKETGFFDKKMLKKYRILTSKGIQERYIEATKKRKDGHIKKEFDVLTDAETPVSAPETPVSAPESTQSKVKKRESKGEQNKLYKDAPAELHPTIESFIEMRKKIKAPMTDEAVRLMIKKTNKMAGGDIAKSRAIMEQSIMNGWKGVFPLREDGGRGNGNRNEVLEMLKAGEFDD